LFSFTVTYSEAFNVDAVQLPLYLLASLVLLVGAQRNSKVLSLLSGLLLGMAVIIKETSLMALPLALFAALLFGWSFRRVLLHYVGVGVVCLPYWAWAWAVSGKVYVISRFPSKLVIPVVAALVLTALFVVGLYRSGKVTPLLAKEQWRRWIGWFVVLAPTAVVSGLVLSAGYESLGGRTTLEYTTSQLGRDIRLWYLLPFAGVYVLWEAVRGHRAWGFYLALLVLQVPVSLIMLQTHWNTRQWLILQTLLYGAVAGLVVKVCRASMRQKGLNLHRSLAFGAAAVLILVLVQGAVMQVRSLLDDEYRSDAYGNKFHAPDHYDNEVNSSVRDMHGWIAANIPEGEKIVTTRHYASQLAFQDNLQHEWTLLQIDGCGSPADNRCRPGSEEIAQAPPHPAVWFDMDKNCKGQALSLPALTQQMESSGSTYLLTTQEQWSYPFNLAWAPYLESSGAFEVVYSSYLPGAPTAERPYGLVLLKRTGQNDVPVPTQPTLMSGHTVDNLIGCERAAHGEQYAQRISSAFPSGIKMIDHQRDVEQTRRALGEIYGTG
jgi:hypothetical protein